MERWVGKTAVVTGAGAGLGAAICVRLASEGMRVVALDRRADLAEAVENLKKEVTGTGRIIALNCDVSKSEDIAAVFDKVELEFGGIDLLVNNAGLLIQGNITEAYPPTVNDDDIQQMVAVNIMAVILCSRRAVASMKKRGVEGHIININSVVGHYLPSIPVASVYPSTKHAVTAFTTALTDELAHAQARIKTTSISPGLVDSPMGRRLTKGQNVLRLRPADVAAAVIYAVSTPPDVNIQELKITPLDEKRC